MLINKQDITQTIDWLDLQPGEELEIHGATGTLTITTLNKLALDDREYGPFKDPDAKVLRLFGWTPPVKNAPAAEAGRDGDAGIDGDCASPGVAGKNATDGNDGMAGQDGTEPGPDGDPAQDANYTINIGRLVTLTEDGENDDATHYYTFLSEGAPGAQGGRGQDGGNGGSGGNGGIGPMCGEQRVEGGSGGRGGDGGNSTAPGGNGGKSQTGGTITINLNETLSGCYQILHLDGVPALGGYGGQGGQGGRGGVDGGGGSHDGESRSGRCGNCGTTNGPNGLSATDVPKAAKIVFNGTAQKCEE